MSTIYLKQHKAGEAIALRVGEHHVCADAKEGTFTVELKEDYDRRISREKPNA